MYMTNFLQSIIYKKKKNFFSKDVKTNIKQNYKFSSERNEMNQVCPCQSVDLTDPF